MRRIHASGLAAIGPLLVTVLLAGCGGTVDVPSADEERTAAYFESIRNSAAQARAFLERMPKGGDIHNHLSGAVMAESYIRWAAEAQYCVQVATFTLTAPPCNPAAGVPLVSEAVHDPAFYDQLLDALSMRNFVPGAETGHDHFFATFTKFNAISSIKTGDMLAEVAARWQAEQVSYLELLLSLRGGSGARTLVNDVPWDISKVQDILNLLLTNPLFAGYIADARSELDADEARMRSVLGCGTSTADPACGEGMTLRYIYQVSRMLPPVQVFATAVFGAELAAADPRVVGINLVAPEDGPVALSDYVTHMEIIAFVAMAIPGVHVSLHAGELTPEFAPDEDLRFHIRAAVEVAQASRIGHGVDLMWENGWPQLTEEMADRRTLVEICLSSNDFILGIRGPAHPFDTYRAQGVPLTLATDDAGISRIDLTHEYQRATDAYDLHYGDLKTLARNSLEYGFLPGKSLWQMTVPFVITDECAGDSPAAVHTSRRCRDLLDGSKHAWQQWRLEADFASFERTIAVSP